MGPVIERNRAPNRHPGAEPILYPLSEAIEPQVSGEVKLGKGPLSFSMPNVVALAIVASVGGFATAWINKPSPGDPTQLAAQIKSEMSVLRQENTTQSAALIQRLSGVETKVDRLQDSQDRMRERFNEELLNRYGGKAAPSSLDDAIGRQLQK